MLLTIFYVTATWMRSKRLGLIRKNIFESIANDSSIVCYKTNVEASCELQAVADLFESFEGVDITSDLCKNKENAKFQKFLWFSNGFRGCALSPQQIIDVSNWIMFSKEEKYYPLNSEFEELVLSDPKLFLLVEAEMGNLETTASRTCNLGTVGVPKVWRADDKLAIILESDIYHLAEMVSSLILPRQLFLKEGFLIKRVETISIEGKPCTIMKSDQAPGSGSPVKTGWSFYAFILKTCLRSCLHCGCGDLNMSKELVPFKTATDGKYKNVDDFLFVVADDLEDDKDEEPRILRSPSRWKRRVELLQSYTNWAEEAAKGQVTCKLGQSVSLAAGNAALGSELSAQAPSSEYGRQTDGEEIVGMVEEEQLKAKSADALTSDSRRKSDSVNVLSSDSSPLSPSNSSFGVSAHSTPLRPSFQGRKNTFSSLHSIGSASVTSIGSGKSKPPNVLVYSESSSTTLNIKSLLGEILHKHKYTIYNVTPNQLASSVWAANCSLLVICGNVPEMVEPSLISYLLRGGKLLCLCSTFLHTLLPTFRTAEVRERELVRFTYGRWTRVRLMHHVFCYQNSPARTKFSREADEPPTDKDRVSPVPQTPATVEIIDNEGTSHTLHVQVLGAEETWQTPSLLLAYFVSPGGRAVFSQVHLELNPSDCSEGHEEEALRHSDVARREIMRDLLSTHLGLECTNAGTHTNLTVGYFLGRHELKLEFLNKVKHLKRDGILRLGELGLKFCGKGEVPPAATPTLLPILVHSCPRDFSTLDYFENLHTESLGRLLIYCEVVGSSMDVINGELAHGLAVVPSQQTSGKGRSLNQWLSPPGCAMFSLQIHLTINSYLGSHPSVLQHAVAVAIVSSIYDMDPKYVQAFDLRLKWPNDLYIGDEIKIGGTIATCIASGKNLICNLGVGINLDNEAPTTCLNSYIQEYNKIYDRKLKKIGREKLLAGIFTHLEKTINEMQTGNVDYMYNLYYRYWLHGGAEVKVVDPDGNVRAATVHGIDEHGFLEVREATGKIFGVHPDGNSFDMLEGLIMPKIK